MAAPKSNSRTRDELFRIWSDMSLQIPPSVLMSYVNTGRVDALKLIRDEVSRVISGETKGVDPDVLRRKLKPKGPEEATVVLTRVGNTAMAYLCRAEHV